MSDERFAAYLSTSIVDRAGRIWAGPGAIDHLPVDEPVFVITAHNPGLDALSDIDNATRNDALRRALNDLDPASIDDVIGRADPGGEPWEEASFAVTGVHDTDIGRLAAEYGQWAYFVLTETEQRVVAVDEVIDHPGAVRPRQP